MPSSTAANKAKGRRLQQWVRDLMLDLSGLSNDDVVSRPMGSQGTDVMLSAAAQEVFPLAVECKNQERVNLWSSWDQARANCPEENIPTLIIKKNKEKPLAVVDAETFLRIVAKVSGHE